MRHFNEYEGMLAWLFSQFPSYQTAGGRAYKSGIDTMLAFDALLDHPHRRFRSIHVAGTNGKGSTCSMLAAALAACGLRVGLYTSPHMTDFRERMKIVEWGSGRPTGEGHSYRMVPREFVWDFVERYFDFFETERPSFFEITTAMAFQWFAEEQVDIAVIETGLGGRLDSTNIITPLLSVITNIGLEHCQYLGDTLEAIAGEKAGIIKPGVPAVVGEFLPETRPVFEAAAQHPAAPAGCAEPGGAEIHSLFAERRRAKMNVRGAWAKTAAEKAASPLYFASETDPFIAVTPADLDLAGDCQALNLRTVQTALKALSEVFPGLDAGCLAEGLRHAAAVTGLHGRWETIRTAGDGRARIICDAGHNAHAFRWIREQIDKYSCDYSRIVFILGVVADKDLDAIAGFLPRDVDYIFTQPTSGRALPEADLANALHDCGISGRIAKTLPEALALADTLTGEADLVFIAGSCYLIADLLALQSI